MYRQLKVPRIFLAGVPAEAKTVTLEDSDQPLLNNETSVQTKQKNSYMSFFPKLDKISRVRWLSIATAVVHLVSALTLIYLYAERQGDKPISRVNRVAVCWGGSMNMTNHIDTEPSSGWDRLDSIATLIIIFFFLSAIFQGIASSYKDYDKNIELNQPQYLRYAEYSVSASLMIISIFMSFGLLDSYLHMCVFFLTFLCMLMGLAADVIRNHIKSDNTNLKILLRQVVVNLHYLSWLPMLVPWFILFYTVMDLQTNHFKDACNANSTLITNNEDTTENSLPWFVWFILVIEGILFAFLGLVQQFQFSDELIFSKSQWGTNFVYLSDNADYNAAKTGTRTEVRFLILSLTAKSLLGWTIFSQVLVS